LTYFTSRDEFRKAVDKVSGVFNQPSETPFLHTKPILSSAVGPFCFGGQLIVSAVQQFADARSVCELYVVRPSFPAFTRPPYFVEYLQLLRISQVLDQAKPHPNRFSGVIGSPLATTATERRVTLYCRLRADLPKSFLPRLRRS
jgi:hypothetical protein